MQNISGSMMRQLKNKILVSLKTKNIAGNIPVHKMESLVAGDILVEVLSKWGWID